MLPRATLSALALSALIAAGCGPGDGIVNETQAVTDGGSYLVMYSTSPGTIPLNESFSLTAMVHDNADTSRMIMDASVAVDARMPEHGHGMNTAPEVTSGEDGTYTAEGMLFHMAGTWEIMVDVTRDGATEEAVFEVECCED